VTVIETNCTKTALRRKTLSFSEHALPGVLMSRARPLQPCHCDQPPHRTTSDSRRWQTPSSEPSPTSTTTLSRADL